jgi:hypothetical protein
VPKLFGTLGQWSRIQRESAKVFYHANRLAGAIEIGIDNSINRSLHNSSDYTPSNCD